MYLIKIIVHEDGERLPILVNEKGFPYIQPNVFISTQRGLAWRTLKKKLYAISQLYKWADFNSIDIQDRVSSGQYFSESEINASLFSAIRKSGSKTKITKLSVGTKTFNTYMIYIREYLQWIFSSYLVTLPSTDQRFRVSESKQRIICGWLMKAKISSSNAENEINKGLNLNQQKLLSELIKPDSSNNPWTSDIARQRNYIIILLLMNFGLRPSELLNLKVKDIVIGSISQINIIRNPHDPDYPRPDSPEVKRSGRILPILEYELAIAIDVYITNQRSKLASESKYLFLSDEGEPLSYSSITKIFSCLRSYEALLPRNFTAKSLRHTFSYNMEKQLRNAGIDKDRIAEILMYLRGDDSLESQKIYTKEGVKEEASLLMTSHQTYMFESVVK